MNGSALAFVGVAYVIGSIPTGYWLGKIWKGVDVRQHGSGNLGATNVFRVLGKGPGAVTLVIDILKGMIPVLICEQMFPDNITLAVMVGVAAIVGHTSSVFVRFRGGKGVATSAGVFAALLPLASLAAIIVFGISLAISRFVSLSSMLAAATLAITAWITAAPRVLSAAATAIALFVVWTHRKNIKRLRMGTELKI